MEKALEVLKDLHLKYTAYYIKESGLLINLNEALKELETQQELRKTAIEEIEWAISKPEYASVYLNNALRFLKGSE